jgi:FkbM family methyltransferase
MLIESKKIENMYHKLSVYIAEILSESRFSLANKIPKKLLEKTYFFRTIEYWHECRNEIMHHIRGCWFEIPELSYVFSINDSHLVGSLYSYFKEKQRMRFFKREANVYAKVQDFIFLLPFPYGISELAETFYDECYGRFDVYNRTVIDVGAFIGDTAIYFAGKGTKKVVAFEPAPPLYEIAVKNVQINGLANVISVRNEAVGEKFCTKTLSFVKSWPGRSSLVSIRSTGSSYYKVKVVPLSNIILELGQVDLLKIDCEGYEHIMIKDAYEKEALRNVNHVIVEVHQNPCYILNILQKAHFKIENAKSGGGGTSILYASKQYAT